MVDEVVVVEVVRELLGEAVGPATTFVEAPPLLALTASWKLPAPPSPAA